MRSTIVGTLTAAALAASSGTAFAQAAPAAADGFGNAGQLAIQADLQLKLEGYSASDNGGSGSDILLQPAADYFVINNLSVGGYLKLDLASQNPGGGGKGNSTTTFGFGPRVGYNINIVDKLSFWPDLFVSFETFSTSDNGPSGNNFTLGVFAPVLFHPVPHFFVGLGPILSTDLSRSESVNGMSLPNVPKITTYGIMSTIGGWFSLGG